MNLKILIFYLTRVLDQSSKEDKAMIIANLKTFIFARLPFLEKRHHFIFKISDKGSVELTNSVARKSGYDLSVLLDQGLKLVFTSHFENFQK